MELKEKILSEVKKNGLNLRKYPEFNNDREIVITALNHNGLSLEFASDELKNDKEIVLISINNNNGWGLEYASEDLKNEIKDIPHIQSMGQTPFIIPFSEFKENLHIYSKLNLVVDNISQIVFVNISHSDFVWKILMKLDKFKKWDEDKIKEESGLLFFSHSSICNNIWTNGGSNKLIREIEQYSGKKVLKFNKP